ncbi:MAG: hypothetical protein IJF83_05275 [Methanobrevibacter sp.]|nr:hypothetical protein [Methanobrevibacter sp.]
MKIKSKILVLLLILAVILSVSAVSASEINETSQSMSDDSQSEVVLESNNEDALSASSCNSSDAVVSKASGENESEPVLAMVVSNDINTTVVVNNSDKVVKSVVSGEPVLKSSGKIKTITFYSKNNRHVTKHVGKYKIQVYKWTGYRLGGLRIYVTQNGKYVKRNAFITRAYYKVNGKWRWSRWSHASSGYPNYHHYGVSSDVKISKVQVKIRC